MGLLISTESIAFIFSNQSGKLMIGISTPLCPSTLEPCKMFCATENCSKAAFACRLEELDQHKHGFAGKLKIWKQVEPYIRSADLLASDLITLEQQE